MTTVSKEPRDTLRRGNGGGNISTTITGAARKTAPPGVTIYDRGVTPNGVTIYDRGVTLSDNSATALDAADRHLPRVPRDGLVQSGGGLTRGLTSSMGQGRSYHAVIVEVAARPSAARPADGAGCILGFAIAGILGKGRDKTNNRMSGLPTMPSQHSYDVMTKSAIQTATGILHSADNRKAGIVGKGPRLDGFAKAVIPGKTLQHVLQPFTPPGSFGKGGNLRPVPAMGKGVPTQQPPWPVRTRHVGIPPRCTRHQGDQHGTDD